MSANEYFDIYKKAQNRKCPFRTFAIDLIGSKKVLKEGIDNYIKMMKLFDYISLELIKKNANKQVFRNDENNKQCLVLKLRGYKDKNVINQYDNILKSVFQTYISETLFILMKTCYLTL